MRTQTVSVSVLEVLLTLLAKKCLPYNNDLEKTKCQIIKNEIMILSL